AAQGQTSHDELVAAAADQIEVAISRLTWACSTMARVEGRFPIYRAVLLFTLLARSCRRRPCRTGRSVVPSPRRPLLGVDQADSLAISAPKSRPSCQAPIRERRLADRRGR